MNLLICSIGTRGYLIDHFRENTAQDDRIFGADCFPYAPALQLVDKAFVIPRADDPNYIPQLLRLCQDHSVDCVISINDTELPVLAVNRGRFLDVGTNVVISSPEVVEICYDKYKTYRFLVSSGLGTPNTYLISEKERLFQELERGVTFLPVIFKPRKGSGSEGLGVARDMDTLRKLIVVEESAAHDQDRRFMQEYIDSDQYSLHVFNDKTLQPRVVVGLVNLRRHMDKETFHVRVFQDPELLDLGFRLGRALRSLGPISADVHYKNGQYVILEINPRLSGCHSLTHFAGANFAGKILALAKDEPIPTESNDCEEDLVMLKQYAVMKTTERSVRARLLDYSG